MSTVTLTITVLTAFLTGLPASTRLRKLKLLLPLRLTTGKACIWLFRVAWFTLICLIFCYICFTGGSRFVACLRALGPPATLAVYF